MRSSIKRRPSSPALACGCTSICARRGASGSPFPARRSSAAPPRFVPRLPDRSSNHPMSGGLKVSIRTSGLTSSDTVLSAAAGSKLAGQVVVLQFSRSRQHQDDNGRVGHVYAGLARLFRLLRNTRGAGRSHSLGPVAAASCALAPVENTTASPSGAGRAGCLGGLQGTRPAVAAVLGISPAAELSPRALKCILQIARPAVIVPIVLAQILEPPCTDPYARWCGRGGAASLPPTPIAATLCVGPQSDVPPGERSRCFLAAIA